MPSARPGEPEWRSWLWVVLWTLSIFAVIPLARTIERVVREHVGQEAFGWFALVAILAAAAFAAVRVRRELRRDGSRRGSVAWLAGIAACFALSTVSLWDNPEEAMHFVQYGVLGPLLLRALSHRLADGSVYWIAALCGIAVGCVDEAIQWVTPRRYFGLRDVGLNAYAGALVQLGVAKGIAPARFAAPPSRAGLRAAQRVALGVWALLALFAVNTPDRVARWAPLVPGLAFLVDNPSSMIEYGFRYEDPEIGVFRSRLAPDALRSVDASRGAEVGRIVATWKGTYAEILARFPANRDPYAHEFRVHLFRRDARLAKWSESPPGRGTAHATVTEREDRILRRYFPGAFATCGCALRRDVQARLEASADPDAAYESAVSASLVTRVDEPQILAGFGAALAGLLVAGRLLRPLLDA